MKIILALSMVLSASMFVGQQRHSQPGPPSPLLKSAEATEDTGPVDPIGRTFYRHGYFLFLAEAPRGCEDCYPPLLVTAVSLDQIASGQANEKGILVITYERDSIWQLDGAVDLGPETVDAHAQKIRVKGRTYRYQEATDSAVLKLLQHPMGSIPISRPLIVNKVVPGASGDELISDFHTILRIRERYIVPATAATGDGRSADGFAQATSDTSLLTVFDDGKVEFRVAKDCSNRVNWSCPGSASAEPLRYEMDPAQFSELKALLGRAEVKRASDFLNAAPIFDDYDIEIPRGEGVEEIQALALMPSHFELQQHPALLYLVCKAKEIEHQALGSQEIPDWCKKLPPLQ
jgi:hypothetical protein